MNRRSTVQPTLFTRTSTGPNLAMAASIMVATFSGSVTSVGTTFTRAPVSMAVTSPATISPWLGTNSAMDIREPSAAKAWTMARPMLVPPPVTMTCLPFRPSSIGILLERKLIS